MEIAGQRVCAFSSNKNMREKKIWGNASFNVKFKHMKGKSTVSESRQNKQTPTNTQIKDSTTWFPMSPWITLCHLRPQSNDRQITCLRSPSGLRSRPPSSPLPKPDMIEPTWVKGKPSGREIISRSADLLPVSFRAACSILHFLQVWHNPNISDYKRSDFIFPCLEPLYERYVRKLRYPDLR